MRFSPQRARSVSSIPGPCSRISRSCRVCCSRRRDLGEDDLPKLEGIAEEVEKRCSSASRPLVLLVPCLRDLERVRSMMRGIRLAIGSDIVVARGEDWRMLLALADPQQAFRKLVMGQVNLMLMTPL